MWNLSDLLGKFVYIEISGKTSCKGVLVDVGTDIVVLYSDERYFYIPLVHVQHIKVDTDSSAPMGLESLPATPFDSVHDQISYRKIIDNARGRFVEIYVSGNKTIHGYITSLMNDYFLFYSPSYKTMYVSLQHVKWIIPYHLNITPYLLSNQHFPMNPSTIPLSRTFEQQCKKLEGQLVVFDLGDQPNKIGHLLKVEQNKIELITALGQKMYWNLQHLKTVHTP